MLSLVCLKTMIFPLLYLHVVDLFACCGCNVVVSDEFVESIDVCPDNPNLLNCESTKG